jgi:cell division inhibitor SulA
MFCLMSFYPMMIEVRAALLLAPTVDQLGQAARYGRWLQAEQCLAIRDEIR